MRARTSRTTTEMATSARATNPRMIASEAARLSSVHNMTWPLPGFY
ncbi:MULTISPECIES: hypothetical protein [Nonomuraea]|uniref:Uncharacterized protein n=1 Tax=Nonomuraea mangrovi TaxID=2316207 RepID=A0ABW4SLB9_9ACTN